MPRYVVLYHQLPQEHQRDSHWDVMLEDGDQLLTWALDKSPVATNESNALQLANHRLDYLFKEGRIAGDRGAVERVDAGDFEWITREPDAISIEIRGEFLNGIVCLRRGTDDHWRWGMERN